MNADNSKASAVAFWDETFTSLRTDGRGPTVARALNFFGDVEGKTLLELGCGVGTEARMFAERGARVIAIDTSPIAVERAKEFGIDARVMDAMDITSLGEFDFVFGAMVLHHIEPFNEFAAILRKSVRPGGKAFFTENNGRNCLLMWCRDNLTGRFGIPKLGDDDEHPLTPAEINMLHQHFAVDVSYPSLLLFGLASTYLTGKRFGRALTAIDHGLYRLPFLRPYGYRQDILLDSR